MELQRLFRILVRRWWLVLLPVIVAAIFVVPDLLNRQPAAGGYSASISYTAFQDPNAIPRESGDYQDLWLASELVVNAFTDWVRGSSFRDAVAAELAVRNVVFEAGALGINADNERSVGQIFFSYPNAPTLDQVVEAASDVLSIRSSEAFPQLGGQPAAVTLLHRTPATAAPPPLTDRFGPFLRLGLALLAGIGLALLAHYLDPLVRERTEIEVIGLPIIATIPK